MASTSNDLDGGRVGLCEGFRSVNEGETDGVDVGEGGIIDLDGEIDAVGLCEGFRSVNEGETDGVDVELGVGFRGLIEVEGVFVEVRVGVDVGLRVCALDVCTDDDKRSKTKTCDVMRRSNM